MHSSMRFCDRTISYDTGLNLMQPPPSLKNPGDRPEESCDELGIVILPHNGSIAEIVPGNTHNNPRKNSRKTAVKKISTGKIDFFMLKIFLLLDSNFLQRA